MKIDRALAAIVVIALAHAAVFALYQRPDWYTRWDDQVGYRRLAHALADTGRFTRYPGVEPFVPETIRTPGYPIVVAAIYKATGEHQIAVAAVQGAMFALVCVLVFAIAARLGTIHVARGAALMTALFPPIPYYGALVLTEVFTTLLITAAIWTAIRAVEEGRSRHIALTGALVGLATLTQPRWALLPVALAGAVGVAALLARRRVPLTRWLWMFAVFAVVIAPWVLYNVVYVHRLTLSPAGGLGRATWEASWQGTWPGKVEAALTRLADRPVGDAELDADVDRFAADNGMAAGPMKEYVHQWRDIRAIWTTPTDPRERAEKRIAADDEYLRVGLANIQRDRLGHLVRRVTNGALVLWIAEVPIRHSDIDDTPRLIVRAIWLAQAVLLALAGVGLVFLVHRGRPLEAAPFAALFVYITAVHLPMLAEARYSLPAKPAMLVLAAIALAEIGHRILPQTGDYLP